MENATKTTRSSKPKVRTGCITCKIRRVKCDEVRPQCLRCIRTGRTCDGYVPQVPLSLAKTASIRETRALEFFYYETAPQLSGCLYSSFWKICIQQLALTESSIRYAIIAISVLHEAKLSRSDSTISGLKNPLVASAMQFYNKAINSITKRASTGNEALPVVFVACIAFIYFEGLLGRIDAALSHIKSGINLIQSHRKTHGQPKSPWGQSYRSFQSSFLETELAPTLSSVTLSIREFSQTDIHLSLNPLDDIGAPILGEAFNNLSAAGVGLLDLNNAGLKLFQASMGVYHSDGNNTLTSAYADRVRHSLDLWGENFQSLIERYQGRWTNEEKGGMEYLRLQWLSMKIGVSAGISTEDNWDAHLSEFEEVIRIIESLIPTENQRKDPKSIPRAFSYETSLIDPLTTVAFKCRWPHVRRKALDLLLRIPQQEYIFDASHTHIVLSRIMEIEEDSFDLPPGALPLESALPPINERIHYFFLDPQPIAEDDIYGISFLMKPNGSDSEWRFRQESIKLPLVSFGNDCTSPRLRQVIFSSDNDSFRH